MMRNGIGGSERNSYLQCNYSLHVMADSILGNDVLLNGSVIIATSLACGHSLTHFWNQYS